ncbi:unnamed protein product [Nezara viridula]|uniref:RNase H type-1 domain-containing protein n=1 Tax=Nezara viridula TaxID=85310 RepID=A0A9P0DW55_NEZVI|nr:unnamed protein product [Nezara viridula]
MKSFSPIPACHGPISLPPSVQTVHCKISYLYPNITDWAQGSVETQKNYLPCFMDGSRKDSTSLTGAGVYIENLNIELSIPLVKHATVFQAEVFALLSAAACLEVTNSENAGVTIYSDIQWALQALESPKEIKDNEKADALARKAGEFTIVGTEPAIVISKKHQRKEDLGFWKRAVKEWRE